MARSSHKKFLAWILQKFFPAMPRLLILPLICVRFITAFLSVSGTLIEFVPGGQALAIPLTQLPYFVNNTIELGKDYYQKHSNINFLYSNGLVSVEWTNWYYGDWENGPTLEQLEELYNIIAKSLLKSTKSEQEWAYSNADFIEVSKDFKYKSRIVKRTVKDTCGEKRTVTENVIVYWSRNFYERDLHENARFLDTLEKNLKNPKGFRVTDMQARQMRQFFRGDILNSETGEVIEASKLRALLDKKKLEEFKSHFGFYQIITSEINMPVPEVIEKYHGLTRIEDQFRVMKSDLETRPVYVRTREHIEAHLLVCLIALTMIRMIQCKICHSGLVPKSESS